MRRVIKAGGLDVTQGLGQLVKSAPKEHQKRFSEVLAIDDYSSIELAQLWVDGEEFLPEQWISAWEQKALSD